MCYGKQFLALELNRCTPRCKYDVTRRTNCFVVVVVLIWACKGKERNGQRIWEKGGTEVRYERDNE